MIFISIEFTKDTYEILVSTLACCLVNFSMEILLIHSRSTINAVIIIVVRSLKEVVHCCLPLCPQPGKGWGVGWEVRWPAATSSPTCPASRSASRCLTCCWRWGRRWDWSPTSSPGGWSWWGDHRRWPPPPTTRRRRSRSIGWGGWWGWWGWWGWRWSWSNQNSVRLFWN